MNRQFKNYGSPFQLTEDQNKEIVAELFPIKPPHSREKQCTENYIEFSLDEITEASTGLKVRKAPGPDRLTPEVIKTAVKVAPEVMLKMLNVLLKQQVFPVDWKISRLVLVPKPGKPVGVPSSYRPLCISDVIGKLYEHLVRGRLEREMEEKGGICSEQYGFARGKSTVDAIRRVLETAGRQRMTGRGKRWCILVTLDIKNAFNSPPWGKIMERLDEIKVSEYLKNIIADYFRDRRIFTDRTNRSTIQAGIPQGSGLGPMLWNIFYDPVLRLVQNENILTLAYADDLALVACAETENTLMEEVDDALHEIVCWMKKNQIELAEEKTEAVILNGPRKHGKLQFRVTYKIIEPANEVNYLGVRISKRVYFGTHVLEKIKQVEIRTAALPRLMPNIGGPACCKRRLLHCHAVHGNVRGADLGLNAENCKI